MDRNEAHESLEIVRQATELTRQAVARAGTGYMLIIWGIVWLVRYLKRNREERQRLRMELGKLADEVHLIRQKLEGGKEQESSAESG